MGELQDFVMAKAEELAVPGVAVGLLHEGEEHYAFAGVTSVENPLPVDEATLFQFGSTGKTYTATAIMRLVDQGKLALDDPVRRHLPEFRLRDESAAERVTVLQLLNHTAGWDGDVMTNTGDGDDALERYVGLLADVQQVFPLGERASYNNAALSVAGLIIARLHGTTYEQAIRELLLEPLGMDHTYFFPNEVMTRRFAAGHTQHPDGSITVARPWALPRGNSPAGGMSANARDQITWARFHIEGGLTRDGDRVLPAEMVASMQQPTFDMTGSALGDAVGISWLLRDVGGARLVGHGGTTNGQHSEFVMAPDRGFALISLTNCGPNGPQLNNELERWALERYLGVVVEKPVAISLADAALDPYTGTFETVAATVTVTRHDGKLRAAIEMKPEMAAALRESGEDVPEQPPFVLGLLDETSGRYVVCGGPAEGMTGYFVRDDTGTVTGVHLGGRLATRLP